MLAGSLNLSLNLDPHTCNEIGNHGKGVGTFLTATAINQMIR